jgi:hypothetical protein
MRLHAPYHPYQTRGVQQQYSTTGTTFAGPLLYIVCTMMVKVLQPLLAGTTTL